MKRTVITCASILLIAAANVVAQPRFGNERGNLNYLSHEMLVNPACAGSDDSLSSVSAGARMQWLGVDGAPTSQLVQFQTAAVNRTGLGLSLYNDSYGVSRNMQFGAHYAYKIPLKRGILSLGLQAGVLTSGADAVRNTYDPADPAFAAAPTRSWGFNAGLGAYYREDGWFAGLSIPQLMTNDFGAGDNGEQKLRNGFEFDRLQYCLAGGYSFGLNDAFRLRPTLLLALSQKTSPGYEFMLTAICGERFDFGVGTAAGSRLQVAAGVGVLKNMRLRYQYSQYLGEVHNGFSGIHFISLGYAWNKRNGAAKE